MAYQRATYYNWKDKYAGMTLADIKRLKQLEDENRRLKQMFANQSLEIAMLGILSKKSFKRFCERISALC